MNRGTRAQDPYKTLGVSPDASDEEIKRAYRTLARKFHPDSTGGDKKKEARFKDISTAYGIVGDPKKRAEYDDMRRGGFPSPGSGGRGPGPRVFDLGDLFAMFSGGQPANGKFEYRAYGGGGPSVSNLFGFDAGPTSRSPQAEPSRPRERKVRASDGSLVVQRGDHVYSEIRLSIDQAILGTVEEVPTVAGKATVKVPPGSSSGVKLRLKGKGPINSSGKRGNHYVTVQIDVPKTPLDTEAKKLLAQLMRRIK